MSSRFIKFPRHHTSLAKALEGKTLPPTLEFYGVPRLPGTLCGLILWPDGEVTYQSRRRTLEDQDHFGFRAFWESKALDVTASDAIYDVTDGWSSIHGAAIFGRWQHEQQRFTVTHYRTINDRDNGLGEWQLPRPVDAGFLVGATRGVTARLSVRVGEPLPETTPGWDFRCISPRGWGSRLWWSS